MRLGLINFCAGDFIGWEWLLLQNLSFQSFESERRLSRWLRDVAHLEVLNRWP